MASQQQGSGAIPKTPRQGPHIKQQASAPTKEGWLLVKERNLFELVKRQERRYCVLDGHRLVMYKDRTKRKVKKEVFLRQAVKATVTVPDSFTFEIRGKKWYVPTVVLEACDKDDMLDWVDTLNVAILIVNGPPPPSGGQPHGDVQAGRGAQPAQDKTDPASSQQSQLSDSESEFLNAWFPRLDSEVYIIPPEHMDTVHVETRNLPGGMKIDVHKTQQEIDSGHGREGKKVRDIARIDRVLKTVHDCMKKIKEKAARQREVMVIMTQAKCGLYGAGSQSLYTGAAARNMNSDKPEPLDTHQDFVDLLVIHRHHGILMAAIIPQTGEDPHAVEEELRKAGDYLKQAGDVVRRCVLSDLATQPAVHQAILLPDTTTHCLEEALSHMNGELEESLGFPGPGRDVRHFCLSKDDMADETDLFKWWTTCLKGGDPAMTDSVYRQLVARFSVPLTTVAIYTSQEPRLQLWTQGHVVEAVGTEHGRPMTRLALFPQQFSLLDETPDDDKDDVRILHGPTGTAKTVVLVLKGVEWLRKDCGTVFVLQTSDDGTAAAYLVRRQLSETVGQGAGSVHVVDMTGVRDRTEEGRKKMDTWVEEVCQHAVTRVHILADEADCDVIEEIYSRFKQRNVRVNLWAAGVKLDVPADMERYVRRLTQPLRCPPVVVREVEQAVDMKKGKVPAYSAPPVTPPCDGPSVVTVTHYGGLYRGDRHGHDGSDRPWRCETCGVEVANILMSLGIGRHDNTPHGQGGLTFNDVFVLGSGAMNCDTHDRDGEPITDYNSESPAPFIRGLESRGVPTRMVAHNDTAAVRQLAEMTSAATHTGRGPGDAVTVTHQDTVWGLERRVVVFMDCGYLGGSTDADIAGRLRAMSRCTSQLIWVKPVKHRQRH